MTKKTFSRILGCSVMAMIPVLANAAGTYYVGNYQSPQQNYSQMGYMTQRQNPQAGYGYGYGMQRQNTNYTQDMTYSRTRTRVVQNPDAYVGEQYASYRKETNTESVPKKVVEKPVEGQKGFWISPALSHEYASWRFDMAESKSILHYDNIRWNVFDVTAGYRFNAGNTPLQIDAGLKYGMQFGDSTMVDDDITGGGYWITSWSDWDPDTQDTNHNGVYDEGEPTTYLGEQYGHSLSVGTTNGGSMLGFNLGLGLTDFFKAGNIRFTPSIGYRYLKYKLETKQTYGMTVDTLFCNTVNGTDETQCDPFASVYLGQNNGGNVVITGEHVLGPQNNYGYYDMDVGDQNAIVGVSTGGTYMFMLPGVSHSYEVEWAGPYLALDMVYDINDKNAITGRVELGLPAYTATGDQPYRADWLHPTSVKDEGSIGDAWHFGLGANYMTAITDTVSFTLGVTFDYYNVSGANASTFFNESYYMAIYNDLLQQYMASPVFSGGSTANAENAMLNGYEYDNQQYPANPTAVNINEMRKSGWVGKAENEIESVYKSLGLRIGINAKF